MNEKFVSNGDVKIQYIVVNYSPAETPVVLIPGAVVSADDMYNDIKEHLDFYSIIISIRGRGKSGSPLEGYTKDDQISDIEAVVNAESLDVFYLAGHSFGASLAYGYSIKYPKRIKGLIGVDFPAIFPGYPERWAQQVKDNVPGVNENFVNGMVRDCVYEDFTDELAKLNSKKLFIKGSGSDSLLKLETANKLVENLPNSTLKIIDGGGHELFAEKPNEILKEIERFIFS
jgi:pimeloyl-ACP methyl ester carboxylesterase